MEPAYRNGIHEPRSWLVRWPRLKNGAQTGWINPIGVRLYLCDHAVNQVSTQYIICALPTGFACKVVKIGTTPETDK